MRVFAQVDGPLQLGDIEGVSSARKTGLHWQFGFAPITESGQRVSRARGIGAGEQPPSGGERLADRPVRGRTRSASASTESCTIYTSREYPAFAGLIDLPGEGDEPATSFDSLPGYSLRRSEMFDTQFHRKLWLAAAAAGFLTVAGCSNQATNEAAATTPEKAEPPKAASVSNKAPQPATMVTVPKGTAISATVGQTLASNKNHVGDMFAARLTTPVQVEGKTVIPKGAKVVGRVVKVKNKELKVTLASVELHGKSYELETNSVAQS